MTELAGEISEADVSGGLTELAGEIGEADPFVGLAGGGEKKVRALLLFFSAVGRTKMSALLTGVPRDKRSLAVTPEMPALLDGRRWGRDGRRR